MEGIEPQESVPIAPAPADSVLTPPPQPPAQSISSSPASSRRTRAVKAAAPSSAPSSDSEESCPICEKLGHKKKKGLGRGGNVVWVECDKCNVWYHWSCASANPLDSIDNIDKWYCPTCAAAHSLHTTYKAAPRKSARALPTIDYKNLNNHLPADVGKWERVVKTRKVIEGGYKEVTPDRLGKDAKNWIYEEDSWTEPVLVRGVNGKGCLEEMGMKMPDRDIKISKISSLVGPKTPIEVIDVASQSSLAHWTVAQWATYYEDPKRDKVRNVISLEVSESKLAAEVEAPEIVRHLDWVEKIWPKDRKGTGEYPKVQKYCLMSVEKCWTDWHIDFAGSSVFYHVLRGGKIFYFIRPTDHNLAAYERWSGSAERQETTWLGDECDAVYKVELGPGDTMIIPTGWIHAVYTPSDSLVFGGNFLHSLNISTQLKIYAIELATKVPKKFRFPQFVRLLWYTAQHYSTELQAIFAANLSPSPTLPPHLPIRVLTGLKELSAFLIEQTTRMDKNAPVTNERRRVAKDNVPSEVTSPIALSLNFRKLVLKALGESEDELCLERPPLPPKVTDKEKDKERSATPTSANGKRKVDSSTSALDLEPPTKMKFKNLSNGDAKPRNVPAALKPKGAAAPPKSVDNSILSRKVVPIQSRVSQGLRLDPSAPELGERPAEVKETESTTEVVRRLEESGEYVLETRTVTTKVERVRWIDMTKVDQGGKEIPSVLKPISGSGVMNGSNLMKLAPRPSLPPQPPTFPPFSPYHPSPQHHHYHPPSSSSPHHIPPSSQHHIPPSHHNSPHHNSSHHNSSPRPHSMPPFNQMLQQNGTYAHNAGVPYSSQHNGGAPPHPFGPQGNATYSHGPPPSGYPSQYPPHHHAQQYPPPFSSFSTMAPTYPSGHGQGQEYDVLSSISASLPPVSPTTTQIASEPTVRMKTDK